MTLISFTYFITFISLLKFLSQESFIMIKYYLNYISLTQFILAENIQISSSYNYYAHLKLSCVLADTSKKYSKCVHVKKLCFFSLQSFFHAEISYLLCACEKLEQNQIIMKKEKECLILHLFKLQLKSLCFHHHQ